MISKTVILSVHEDKVDHLVGALEKRDYIDVIRMDRESRKHLRNCPCCGKRLSKEVQYVIDEKILYPMLGLIRKMSVAKSVILVNKDNPIDSIPPVERERCSEFDRKLLHKAEALGLIKPFIDGVRKTYFTDALAFFLNEETHSPSFMVTLDGEVIETGGSMFFDEIRFKDDSVKTKLRREFREAIQALPSSTVTFVEKGQMSLV